MCGRFSLAQDAGKIKKAFKISLKAKDVKSSYNEAPSQNVAGIVNDHKDISNSILDLSDDKERCDQMTNNARQVIEKNKGSKDKIMKLIQPLLELH